MNTFILTLFNESDKLRSSSLYHLLKGKRTTSVIFFGFFHEIMRFLGMFPTLSEEQFKQQLRGLTKDNFLKETAGEYFLTPAGLAEKRRLQATIAVSDIDFFELGRTAEECWRLTKLAVQIISNLQAGEKSYFLIEADVLLLNRLKKWLHEKTKAELVSQLPIELSTVFTEMAPKEADFLANQFSGYQTDGLVNYQILGISERERLFLLEQQAIHSFLKKIQKQPQGVLYDLLILSLKKNQNQSMLVTKELFLAGYTLAHIQQERNLAKGTIQDHMIEWAIQDTQFPFNRFLSAATQSLLSELKSPAKTWIYKDLYRKAPLDYFEFRLFQIQRHRKEQKYANN